MSFSGTSLRSLVDKWMGATGGIRITQFIHGVKEQYRFVRIERASDESPIAVVFFRHSDGNWCVFPPAPRRPAMKIGG